MRRSIISVAVAASLLLVAAPTSSADTYPGGAEGCVASSSGTKICKLDPATRDGGYVGSGSFKVTIVRKGKKIVLTDKTHKAQCTTAIMKGDKVTVESISGGMAAGNPFPAGSPSTGGTAGDYKACKK